MPLASDSHLDLLKTNNNKLSITFSIQRGMKLPHASLNHSLYTQSAQITVKTITRLFFFFFFAKLEGSEGILYLFSFKLILFVVSTLFLVNGGSPLFLTFKGFEVLYSRL